jgi:hypothetical protein
MSNATSRDTSAQPLEKPSSSGGVRDTTTSPNSPTAPSWMCAPVAGSSIPSVLIVQQTSSCPGLTIMVAVPLPSGSPGPGTSAAPVSSVEKGRPHGRQRRAWQPMPPPRAPRPPLLPRPMTTTVVFPSYAHHLSERLYLAYGYASGRGKKYTETRLFTQMRGIRILRTSPFGDSRKSRFRFLDIPPCEAVAMLLVGGVPCVARREPDVSARLHPPNTPRRALPGQDL